MTTIDAIATFFYADLQSRQRTFTMPDGITVPIDDPHVMKAIRERAAAFLSVLAAGDMRVRDRLMVEIREGRRVRLLCEGRWDIEGTVAQVTDEIVILGGSTNRVFVPVRRIVAVEHPESEVRRDKETNP